MTEYVPFKPIRNIGLIHGLHIVTFKNNGRSIKIEPLDDSSRPTLSRGPMDDDQYKLVEFHFHWGENDQIGSETQINGETFPLELHVVFYNTKYQNYSTAKNMTDGLTVISALFEVSSHIHTLNKIITI